MKKLILFAFAGCLALTMVFWPETNAHSNGSGAPTGYTGSPHEFSGRTCGSGGGCHGGGATNQAGWITSDIPACGYTPGQTYTITVFVTFPGRTKFGFSLSPQNTNTGATAGTMVAGTGTQLQSSSRYITHTSAGTAQTGTNSRTWTFQWTAPATGIPVTFYAALNATNSSTSPSGDIIYTSTLSVTPNTPLSISNSGTTVFCAANPVTLTSNLSTGNAWTLNGLPIGTNASVTTSTGGIYEVTNTNGACVQTQSLTLAAISGPPVLGNITVGAEGTQLCNGASTTLSLGGSNLVWSPDGQTTNSITVTQAGSYAVSSTNECGTATTTPVVVTTANTPAEPVIGLIADEGLCEGNTAVLEVDNPVDGASYTWTPVNQAGTSVAVDVSGLYQVSATNACGTSTADFDVQFAPYPGPANITLTGEGFLHAGVVAEAYTWFVDGVLIDGATDSLLLPVLSGVYEVQGINGDVCAGDLSAPYTVEITQLEAASSDWKFYPQPAQGLLHITSPELASIREIEVYDVTGKRCDRIAVNGQQTLTYASSLRPGV